MKVFQVGGSVRDKIIGRKSKDRDWVIVGGSEKQLLELGYRRVGKQFPVFLHPETNEEYALARTEKKTGVGHSSFTTSISMEISLEEDLARRDFTINAMAMDSDGRIIDPYKGLLDIQTKILRHVTKAFTEDPLRILRAARFGATFGFQIAPETKNLMSKMVKSEEIKTLSAERIEREFRIALAEKWPSRFFKILKECGAITQTFPECDLIEFYDDHSGLFKALANTTGKEKQNAERHAIFCLYLNKYSRIDNSEQELITQFSEKLRVANESLELAQLLLAFSTKIMAALDLEAQRVLDLLISIDAFRRPSRFIRLLETIELSQISSTVTVEEVFQRTNFLRQAIEVAKNVNANKIFGTKELTKIHFSEINAKIAEERVRQIETVQNQTFSLDKK